ncbi:MAG: thiamine phosphate synthase [Deltaproteobacteria bacterium]|nr:thiamine phosphate synthase [Deltaproteobacteria bacterium]
MKIQGLYTIVDNSLTPQYSHLWLAEQYLKGGARTLQLRDKKGPPPFETARQIMALKKNYDFTFIVNDYLEVALEVKADGWHGGKDDLPIIEARKLLGPERIIGYSSHSLEEALVAEQNGADYVAFGAIFPTTTKQPGHPIQGLEKLHEVCRQVKVPVVAIGGIHRVNVDGVIQAGASAVAMISGLTKAKDIAEEVAWYVQKIG